MGGEVGGWGAYGEGGRVKNELQHFIKGILFTYVCWCVVVCGTVVGRDLDFSSAAKR